MGRKRRWWSKKAKKESERRERELAEEKAKGCSDFEDRQERIKVLWDLDDHLLKAAKNPKAKKAKEHELKAEKLEQLLKSIKVSGGNHDLVDRVSDLFELAALQDLQIEYLKKFRCDWEQIEAHYPDQLEDLYTNSIFAPFRLFTGNLPAEVKPKNWEYRRRRYKLPSGIGLIEYEFGGAGEVEWRKHSLCAPLGLRYQPTCLDKIFAGGAVKMHENEGEIREPGLQNLFGMHRNRFPKNMRGPYDFRAVTKIMKALLSEPSERKTPARGCPKQLWPSDPDLITPVLCGIEARVKTIASEKRIVDEFVNVVRDHLPDSAKK